MQFRHGHAEVLAEGFGETANFTIAASGKAFKGLIDGLYSRKIEAAIRELATNAFDSHKAARSIAPFEVHLPTALQPTFWIRDYGVGMSHALMMRRYTTLFDSTKDGTNASDLDGDDGRLFITATEANILWEAEHSGEPITATEAVALFEAAENERVWDPITGHGLRAKASLPTFDPVNDQVGMLGLGSKAFFAYTDSCTITVWQDGVVRLYTVFMGPSGVPTIAKAGEAASDDPTGVKVEFAVKNKDFPEFQKAAIRVFKGFPVLPTGLPTMARDELAVVPSEMGAFWKAFPKDYLPGGGFYARQGCVLYPIDLVQIDDKAIEEDTTDAAGNAKIKLSGNYERFAKMDLTIVMDFPIGSLEFDLSRERLAYSDDTVKALRSRWSEFIADLDKVIEVEFAGKGTGWERANTVRSSTFTDMGPLFAQNSYFLEAQGIEKTIRDMFPPKRNERVVSKHAFFSGIEAQENADFGVRPEYVNTKHDGFLKSITVDKIALIYRDEKKGRQVNARIARHLHKIGKVWGLLFDDKALTVERYRTLGCPPIIRVSEIDPIPKQEWEKIEKERSYGYASFDRIKVINEHGNGYSGVADPTVYEDHLFAFINCGDLHNPDPTKYPEMYLTQVMDMHAVLKKWTGKSISFINVKKNEFDKIDKKWGDMPLFYGCLDGFMDTLTTSDLRKMANIINWRRFENTTYFYAHRFWLQNFDKSIRDPIAALGRFKKRYEAIDKTERAQLGHMLISGYLAPFENEIMDRAHKAGLEVLCVMRGPHHRYQSEEERPIALLPKKWERIVAFLQTTGQIKDKPLLFSMLKEYTSC